MRGGFDHCNEEPRHDRHIWQKEPIINQSMRQTRHNGRRGSRDKRRGREVAVGQMTPHTSSDAEKQPPEGDGAKYTDAKPQVEDQVVGM